MRRTLLALTALAATLTAPLKAEPLVLKPYGPWNVDYGEDSCRLQRLFGTAEDKHVLMFQQYWPDNRAGLTLAGSAIGKFRTDERTQLGFADGQEPLRATAFVGGLGDYGDALIFSSVSLEEPEPPANALDDSADSAFRQMDLAFGKQARFVAVRQGGREVRFATGAMDQAFEVLNQCTLELLRGMGLDADMHVTMQSRPRWLNQAALVRRIIALYPRDAAAQGEQGIMRMRVIVGEDGKVESCSILKATTTLRLESPACQVMERAEFAPARDAQGKPFRSLYATSLTYKMQ
jgi:TonB family protein